MSVYDENECVICTTYPPSIIFNPCRHLCCCSGCSIRVLKCPMCREVIHHRSFSSGQVMEDENWKLISKNEILTEPFIERCMSFVDWNLVSACQELSETFMEKHARKINWGAVSYNKKIKMSDEFMMKHISKLHWKGLQCTRQISEVLRKYYIKKFRN